MCCDHICPVCGKAIAPENLNNPNETVCVNGMHLHKQCCTCCCCHKQTSQPQFHFCGLYCPECYQKMISLQWANSFMKSLWNGWHCNQCMTNFLNQQKQKGPTTMPPIFLSSPWGNVPLFNQSFFSNPGMNNPMFNSAAFQSPAFCSPPFCGMPFDGTSAVPPAANAATPQSV